MVGSFHGKVKGYRTGNQSLFVNAHGSENRKPSSLRSESYYLILMLWH